MKQLTALVFASVLGGVITLGGYFLLMPSAVSPMQSVADQSATPNAYAQFTNNNAQNIAPTRAPFDFTQAAEKTMPAVVHITAKQSETTANKSKKRSSPFDLFGGDLDFFFGPQGPKQGTGSGVIIDATGYIVTNNHVVDFADEITVTTYDKRKFKAELVGKDPTTDLAVIKIEGSDLQSLRYGNSDNVKVGEWVLAVGNPFNLTSTVTAGIVSAKGRSIDILQERAAIESFIQTDAAVNPGNSGGALVDQDGNLIGINTAIASSTGSFAGYSFAIPAQIVEKVVKDLVEFGSAQRGFLGINIQNLDSELAEELDVDISEGVHIVGVEAASAASEAGIEDGDVITAVNGKEVKSAPELQELVGRKRPGDEVELTVMRGRRVKVVTVRLKGSDE